MSNYTQQKIRLGGVSGEPDLWPGDVDNRSRNDYEKKLHAEKIAVFAQYRNGLVSKHYTAD